MDSDLTIWNGLSTVNSISEVEEALGFLDPQ